MRWLMILLWVICCLVKSVDAQTMTVSQVGSPKLEYISCEPQKSLDHHPSVEFKKQFIISWIMADWWKSIFGQLSTEEKSLMLEWMNGQSKAINRQREVVWRQLEKQFSQGFIKWLIGELSDVLVNSFVFVQLEIATSQIAVPIIDYYMCQIADLMSLEYLCRYKAAKDGFSFDQRWFGVVDQPIPPEIMRMIEKAFQATLVQGPGSKK